MRVTLELDDGSTETYEELSEVFLAYYRVSLGGVGGEARTRCITNQNARELVKEVEYATGEVRDKINAKAPSTL